jgi:hypothetical protein
MGGQGLRVSEEVGKRFGEVMMKVDVYSVNREMPSEESLKEEIRIDLSCLLFPKNKVDVSILRLF